LWEQEAKRTKALPWPWDQSIEIKKSK